MYQVKVKYDKMQDNGCVKPVTDTYIVDALSFTEAEARTVEYVQPYISGEFTVTDIKRVKVAELWEAPAGGDYWFEAQLAVTTGLKPSWSLSPLTKRRPAKSAQKIVCLCRPTTYSRPCRPWPTT